MKRLVAPLNNLKLVKLVRQTYFTDEDVDGINSSISSLILEGASPFIVGRAGRNEIEFCGKRFPVSRAEKEKIQVEAGFYYQSENEFEAFQKLYIDAYKALDICGCWTAAERAFLSDSTKVTTLNSLEPFFSEVPWTEALKGLNVVAISPFAASFESQFSRGLSSNFEKMYVLPPFSLRCVNAIQTNGKSLTPGKTWFENLDQMYRHVLVLNESEAVDVCLIGCGAYGLPLAHKLKNRGVSSIVLGGVNQLLFSVYGTRHQTDPRLKALIQENWVRPASAERPKDHHMVEGGAYW